MHNFWLLLAGVFTFLVAIFVLWKEVTMRRFGVYTTGVIVGVRREVQWNGDGGRAVLYRPLVQFVTVDGQQVLWRSTSASSFGRNAQGKPMRLIYDPRNPQRVIINSWTNYLVIALLCLMSVVCLALFFGVIPTS